MRNMRKVRGCAWCAHSCGLWLIFDLTYVVAPGIHLFIIKFCLIWREVKAMMDSQKVPWRKEVHSWRIIQEEYFSRIFGHDF